MLRELRRAVLSAMPEPLSKIIRCIGAPNKFIHFPDPTYSQDALVTRHNADFMHEPRFAESYRLGKATGSWPGGEPAWRTMWPAGPRRRPWALRATLWNAA